MFVIQNLVITIVNIVSTLIGIYSIVVIISALLSWVNPDPYNVIVRTLRAMTEPVYYRVRKWLPFTMVGGIDLSPIVVLIALQLIDGAILNSLLAFAYKL